MAAKSDVLSYVWFMYIAGEQMGVEDQKRVTNIELSGDIGASDLLTFDVHDPQFMYIADALYDIDAKIRFELYVHGIPNAFVFDGYIAALDISFPEEGIPTLRVYCLDETHLMNRKEESKTWKNQTREAVVKEIAKKYGYTTDIETGYTFRSVSSITQTGATDIAFLESLAEDEPDLFYLKLVNRVILFKRLKVADTYTATLGYRTPPYSLISFTPKVTKEGIQTVKSAGDIDPASGDEFVNRAYADAEGLPVSSDSPTSNSRYETYYNRDTGAWEYRLKED